MSQILLSSYPSVFPNAYSLLFNGSSQNITLPGAAVDPDSDFTIEAWVKLSADATSNFIFSGVTDSQNYWGLVARNDGEGLCFQEAIASASATFICTGAATVSVADGWTHVAVTRSGNTWSVYKNGVLLKTAPNSDTGFTTSSEGIASLLGPFTNYFAGNIDEVRTWDVARTQTEIAENRYRNLIPADEPNLVGYWRFEEGSGSTAQDETTNNDGTEVGTPTYSTDKPY